MITHEERTNRWTENQDFDKRAVNCLGHVDSTIKHLFKVDFAR